MSTNARRLFAILFTVAFALTGISIFVPDQPVQADGYIPGAEFHVAEVFTSTVGITTTNVFSVELYADVSFPITISFGLELPLVQGEIPYRLWTDNPACWEEANFWFACRIDQTTPISNEDVGLFEVHFFSYSEYISTHNGRMDAWNSEGSLTKWFSINFASPFQLEVNVYPEVLHVGDLADFQVLTDPYCATMHLTDPNGLTGHHSTCKSPDGIIHFLIWMDYPGEYTYTVCAYNVCTLSETVTVWKHASYIPVVSKN